MNPLSPASSLNTERARIDAGRAHAAVPEARGAGGFAQLLQGARATPAPAPAEARAPQPPAEPHDTAKGPASEDTRHEAAREAARENANKTDSENTTHSANRTAAKTPSDAKTKAPRGDQDDEPADAPNAGRAGETGPTLAHWLLHGGPQAADAAASAAQPLPPAQQPGVATDDLKAAAMARQVLDAVRQRAKAGPAGKADAEPVGATPRDGADDAAKATAADTRFADALGQVAGAAQGTAPAPAAAPLDSAAPPPAERAIDTPVQDPGFGAAVGVSISRLAKEGVHEARLQLNPAELGPLSVHIEMQGREARLSLGAAHAETRALLDASLPALTEAFRADGLVLAATQVSELSPEQGTLAGQGGQDPGQGRSDGWAQAREGAGGGRPGPHGRGEPGSARHITLPEAGTTARPGRAAPGALDLYA